MLMSLMLDLDLTSVLWWMIKRENPEQIHAVGSCWYVVAQNTLNNASQMIIISYENARGFYFSGCM